MFSNSLSIVIALLSTLSGFSNDVFPDFFFHFDEDVNTEYSILVLVTKASADVMWFLDSCLGLHSPI